MRVRPLPANNFGQQEPGLDSCKTITRQPEAHNVLPRVVSYSCSELKRMPVIEDVASNHARHRSRPCFSSLGVRSVPDGDHELVNQGDGRSVSAVDSLRSFTRLLPSLPCRCTAFARGLRRSTHLAVLRIEKSLGSDNLMTCFQAEPTWRGSDPDMYDRPYRLQISWTLGAISAYRLLGRSGKRWCSI